MQAGIVKEIRRIGDKWKPEWLSWMVHLFKNAKMSDSTLCPIVILIEESCGGELRSFSLQMGTLRENADYAKLFACSRETMGYDGKSIFDYSITSSSAASANASVDAGTRMIPLNLWFKVLIGIYHFLELFPSEQVWNAVRDRFALTLASTTVGTPMIDDYGKTSAATASDDSTNSIYWLRIPHEHFHPDVPINIGNRPLKWIGEWSPHLNSKSLLSKDITYGGLYISSFLSGEITWENHTPSPYEVGTALLFPRALKLLFRHNQDQLTRANQLSNQIFKEIVPSASTETPSKCFRDLIAFVDGSSVDNAEHCNNDGVFFGFARDELQLLHGWLHRFPFSPRVTPWQIKSLKFFERGNREWTYENWMKRNRRMAESISAYESLLTTFATECRCSGQLPSALSDLAGHYLPFLAD